MSVMASVRSVFHNYGGNEGVDDNVGAHGEDECVCCGVSVSGVMSQARDDFEGFLEAHMSQEEKVIAHLETSLSV